MCNAMHCLYFCFMHLIISRISALCGLSSSCEALGSCVVCVSVLSVIATPSACVVWTLALGLSLALFLLWHHLHLWVVGGI